MVALLVGSIMIAGVIQLVVSSKQAHTLQTSQVDMNGVERFALNTLRRSLRMSGHWGGVEADLMELQSAPTISDDCSTGFALELQDIEGFEGAATSPFTTCIANDNYVANTDLLVVRYADEQILHSTDPSTITGADASDPWVGDSDHASGLVVRTAIGGNGIVTTAATVVAAAASPGTVSEHADLYDASGPQNPDAEATFNYPLVVELYHISPCADPGANNTCDANDDDGSPVPTLAKIRLVNSTMVREEVVRGVEQLQMQYGVDLDGDQELDRYEDATAVTDWSRVLDVRIGVVVRALRVDRSRSNDPPTESFALPGYTHTVNVDNFRRKPAIALVQLRNATRR